MLISGSAPKMKRTTDERQTTDGRCWQRARGARRGLHAGSARGHSVTLLERSAWLGGKAAVLLSTTASASIWARPFSTLPSVLRRIFGEAGKSLDDYLQLVALDPQWRCMFDDGSQLDLVADTAQMRGSIEEFTDGNGAAGGIRKLHADIRATARRIQPLLLLEERGIDPGYIRCEYDRLAERAGDVLSLRMGRTVADCVRKCVPDERVAQMIDHFTQYVGSAPDRSPAVLCGIAHMQTSEGVWYPMGGTRAIPEALVRLGTELGVEFRTDAQSRDSQSTAIGYWGPAGVRRSVGVDAVVSNSDSVRTHQELIGDGRAKFHDAAAMNRPVRESCCTWASSVATSSSCITTLSSPAIRMRSSTPSIARASRPPIRRATFAAARPTEANVAPEGGEALYVLVHTPYLRPHHNWRNAARLSTDDSREAEIHGRPGRHRENIAFESHLTPDDIHHRYHVLNGAIYGLASHGRFFGGFKPANRSRDVSGLYLAGGAAHPGPGMPMVLMSGWIAADAADQDADEPRQKPIRAVA